MRHVKDRRLRSLTIALGVLAATAVSAGAARAEDCSVCSGDRQCCIDQYFSFLRKCCWSFGPCGKPSAGADEQPVSRAPAAETACYGGGQTVLDDCLDYVDPRHPSCQRPEDPGDGERRGGRHGAEQDGYPFGKTIVWPLMRLERSLLSRGSWTYIVDVPNDVRATLVLLNGVPRHDDETGRLRPDLSPERRGVDGTVKLDGQRIVSMPHLSAAALRRVPLELSAGRHRITFDLQIARVEDDLAILAAYLEFD
ncbi:MAG: hypothetical protein Kow0062_19020 [Acidobacteriota bacterium]